jgi:hypothetical protein
LHNLHHFPFVSTIVPNCTETHPSFGIVLYWKYDKYKKNHVGCEEICVTCSTTFDPHHNNQPTPLRIPTTTTAAAPATTITITLTASSCTIAVTSSLPASKTNKKGRQASMRGQTAAGWGNVLELHLSTFSLHVSYVPASTLITFAIPTADLNTLASAGACT